MLATSYNTQHPFESFKSPHKGIHSPPKMPLTESHHAICGIPCRCSWPAYSARSSHNVRMKLRDTNRPPRPAGSSGQSLESAINIELRRAAMIPDELL